MTKMDDDQTAKKRLPKPQGSFKHPVFAIRDGKTVVIERQWPPSGGKDDGKE